MYTAVVPDSDAGRKRSRRRGYGTRRVESPLCVRYAIARRHRPRDAAPVRQAGTAAIRSSRCKPATAAVQGGGRRTTIISARPIPRREVNLSSKPRRVAVFRNRENYRRDDVLTLKHIHTIQKSCLLQQRSLVIDVLTYHCPPQSATRGECAASMVPSADHRVM